jgi:hypothetical protein
MRRKRSPGLRWPKSFRFRLVCLALSIVAANMLFVWSARRVRSYQKFHEIADEVRAGRDVVTFMWKDILPEVTPVWVEVRLARIC